MKNNEQVERRESQKIVEFARLQLEAPGDYVEFGCYEGDTSLLLTEVLLGTEKRLWIYDSFEGLPDKTKEDESEIGRDFKKGELSVAKKDVKKRFLRAGLPVPIITKAWFDELKDESLPEKIAFAFLDGDFYNSVRDSLRLVGSKMVEGGVIIVHDYDNPALPGVAKAVDEWVRKREVKMTKYQSLAIIRS